MQYKVRYRPLEKLGRHGWERISDQEHDHLIAISAMASREAVPLIDGSSKDGMPGGQEQYRLAD